MLNSGLFNKILKSVKWGQAKLIQNIKQHKTLIIAGRQEQHSREENLSRVVTVLGAHNKPGVEGVDKANERTTRISSSGHSYLGWKREQHYVQHVEEPGRSRKWHSGSKRDKITSRWTWKF